MANSNFQPSSPTSDLIAALARDTRRDPRDPAERLSPSSFVGFWTAGAVTIIGLSVALLPVREDLSDRFRQADYLFLFITWLLAALLPAFRVYASAFPDGRLSGTAGWLGRAALLPFAVLFAWSLFTMNYANLGFQVFRETNYLNGGCGIVILVAGSLYASFLFAWLRRGATSHPARSGIWAALSAGAFVSFLIQFACGNENALHVFFWHFIPLSLLALITAAAGRRFLRW